MQCDKCKVEMQPGRLSFHGANWLPLQKESWWTKPFLQMGLPYVIAWRCPQCTRLEFTTQDKP